MGKSLLGFTPYTICVFNNLESQKGKKVTTKKLQNDYKTTNNDPLMDTIAAAQYIKLNNPATMTVWRCIKRPGQPAYHKIGRSVRYSKSELDAYLARQLIR